MITDYTALIVEAENRTGVRDLATHGELVVGFAEKAMERELRVSDMITTATVSLDSTGSADLPADFLELREAFYSDKREKNIPLETVIEKRKTGFAILNGKIKSTRTSVDMRLDYYAKIPSLHTNFTNWLLTKEPELYLAAVSAQALMREQKYDDAGVITAYATGLVAKINQVDVSAKLIRTMR